MHLSKYRNSFFRIIKSSHSGLFWNNFGKARSPNAINLQLLFNALQSVHLQIVHFRWTRPSQNLIYSPKLVISIEQNMIWLVLTVFSTFFCSAWADGMYFTYGLGVEQWGMISKFCDGKRQSPIDLDTSIAKNVTEPKPLQLVNAAVNPTKVTVKNNGVTVAFILTYPPSKQLVLRGGPLEGEFKFAGLHFHWGCEHSEDHQRHPIEMHLVFYNQDYKSLDEAQFQENGLAVLGYFFTVSSNAKNQRWIDSLQSIKKTGSSYTFVHPQYMNLAKLVGSDLRPYFSYEGSLTTPPCYETVTWLVHREPLLITSKQLKLFQSLRGKFGYMKDNYRPIQLLNDRAITLYH